MVNILTYRYRCSNRSGVGAIHDSDRSLESLHFWCLKAFMSNYFKNFALTISALKNMKSRIYADLILAKI